MRVHHLAFRTDDLERLERFYVDALGLTVVRRQAARSVWLDAGGLLVMLEVRDDGEPPHPPGSKELVAFAIDPSSQSIVADRLERAGAKVEAATEYTLYVRDPDGRRIGLSAYPARLG